jgi:hypothetical protein
MALTVPPNITKGAAKFGWDMGVDLSNPGINTAFTPGSGANYTFPEGMNPDHRGIIEALGQWRREERADDKLERAEQEDRHLRQAQERQKLGKESLAIASMYNQINTLPDKIASAFGGTAEQQLILGTAGNIPAIVAETNRTFPQRNIQAVATAAPNTQYFGRG